MVNVILIIVALACLAVVMVASALCAYRQVFKNGTYIVDGSDVYFTTEKHTTVVDGDKALDIIAPPNSLG